MKRVGILGGTFDPPHIGHLVVAEEVRLGLDLDEIWFLPSKQPPHKDKSFTDANTRVKMLEIAIKGNVYFKVNAIELERPGKSYTVDTMKLLNQLHPHVLFHFIIGADMVEYLPYWYEIEKLMNIVTFIGVNRPGYQLETIYEILELEIPMIDISSTFIRNRLIRKETTKYLIPDAVNSFIREHRLYENR